MVCLAVHSHLLTGSLLGSLRLQPTLLAPVVRFQLSEQLHDADFKPWLGLKVYKLLDFGHHQLNRCCNCWIFALVAFFFTFAVLLLPRYAVLTSWCDSHMFALASLPPSLLHEESLSACVTVVYQQSINICHCLTASLPRIRIFHFPTGKHTAGVLQPTPQLIPACLIFERMKGDRLCFDHPI